MSTPDPDEEPEYSTITFRAPTPLRRRIENAANQDSRNISNFLIVTLDRTLPPLPEQPPASKTS